ncbi:hypothetical protein [Roseateles sp. DAIF2]|uniref:hypothetical protein n=1 Tax=Roseateles sp. DAIF2 TaxID=2714952 RepID=UPI001BC8FC8F|nr:hypothetical protein [Roseateles sp. DAIF2]
MPSTCYSGFVLTSLAVALLLATLTLVGLGVILFGITTATESAAVSVASAFPRACAAGSLNFKKTKEAVCLTAKTIAPVARPDPVAAELPLRRPSG